MLCRPFDTTAPWVSATVQDISKGGVSISTMKEFAKDEILEIKFKTFLKPQPIYVLGRVVSCNEKGRKRVTWVTRISFTDINEEDKPILQELIQIFLKKT